MELTTMPFTYTAGKWYFVEVEFLTATSVEGRVYDSDGTTLLGSITQTYASLTGGVAIRSFSGNSIDTMMLCGG
jgi:hypothetical protein